VLDKYSNQRSMISQALAKTVEEQRATAMTTQPEQTPEAIEAQKKLEILSKSTGISIDTLKQIKAVE